MSFALARALLLADAVTPEALASALLVSATRGTSLVRALLATRAIDAPRLEQQLENGDAPYMRHVAPVMGLVQQLPPGLCERLLALPVRQDPRTGTIDVAIVDARDPHPVEEVSHWLRAPVRMVRTSLASMDAALRRLHAKPETGMRPLAPPIWVPARVPPPQDLSKTPAYGSPMFDESQLVDPEDDSSPTDVMDFPATDPNIPFALTRKSLAPVAIIELGAPAVERPGRWEGEPVLDLKRRKVASSSAPPSPALSPTPPSSPFSAPPIVPTPILVSSPVVPSAPPIAPNAPSPPFPEVGSVLDAIRNANDRDSILELIVAGLRTVARRVGVLAMRKETLVGWTCSPELGDRNVLRGVRLIPAMSDILSNALETEDAHLVRIPKDAAHAPLLAVLDGPLSREVALGAVRVEGKAVALLLADEMGDSRLATGRMQELATVAGDALARMLRERRKV
ncbi:MAG TPA: hypothetical protein VGG39_06490 [Polyangiaceae bacterium]|jgi:hypothetical protein